jgi:hypothetical protein
MLNGKTSFPIPNVLTAYYKDIKGIVCASGCTKSKVVKRKFEDQDNIPAPATAADPPASPPDGRTSSGEEPPPAPSPAGKGGKAAKATGGGKGQG